MRENPVLNPSQSAHGAPGRWWTFVAVVAACATSCKLTWSLDPYGMGVAGAGQDAATDAPLEASADALVDAPDEASPEGGCADGATRTCYSGPPGSENTGSCHSGVSSCSGGVWAACTGEVTPAVETCDGKDEDCDGTADNGLNSPCYTGPAGTAGLGLCRAGIKSCAAGAWGTCVGEVVPIAEDCNGKDDDCDGKTDDVGQQTCYSGPAGTSGVGACKPGVRTCAGGTWSDCAGEVTPSAEVCDAIDEDCNGKVDDLAQDVVTGVPCDQQCTSKINDADCDGLKGEGAQDAWPSDCNPLLFSDGFSTAPAFPLWVSTGTVTGECDFVRIEAGASLSLAQLPPGITSPRYLVEARIEFGEAAPGKYTLGVSSADQGGQQGRACEVRNSGGSYSHTHMRVWIGGQETTTSNNVFIVDDAPGKAIILQSFGTATNHWCRLVSASGMGMLVSLEIPDGYADLPQPGTARLFADGRAMRVDYARMYLLP